MTIFTERRERSVILTTEILIQNLSDQIIYSHICRSSLAHIKGILFPEEGSPPVNDYLYLCKLTDFREDYLQTTGCTFLVCAGGPPSVPEETLRAYKERFDQARSSVLVFGGDIFRLYNRVSAELTGYSQWIYDLQSTDNLQLLSDYACRRTGCTIAVLGSYFQVLAFSPYQNEGDFLFSLFRDGGSLSLDSVLEILDKEHSSMGKQTLLLRFKDKDYIDYPVRNKSRIIARVIVWPPEEEISTLVMPYMNDLLRAVTPLLLSSDSIIQHSRNTSGALIADLVERRLTSQEELLRRLSVTPELLKGKYFHVIVIMFPSEETSVPYHYLSGQLEQIFPDSSVVSYEKNLVVISSLNSRRSSLTFDRGRLQHLLESFDAFAGIGNLTRFLISMRTLYLQALATARLGRIFRDNMEERIFYYNDYSVYHYIDLCFESAVKLHQYDNATHLCHPGVIAILRHDQKNETDLYNTLRNYLENNCNASLCAKKMFVHRNTINYRINVIEELIGGSLSDSRLRLTIQMSFLVLEYEKKYMGVDEISRLNKKELTSDIQIFHPQT